jgi:hypothetical protein
MRRRVTAIMSPGAAVRITAMLVAAMAVAMICPAASAIDMGRALRKIARVADDVPISKLDDAATELASSRFARELVEKTGARVDDVAARARVMKKLLAESADGLPPAVLREVDALEGPAQDAIAVLARGSKKISAAIPDVAERTALIREGGARTLLVIGRYEDLADDAVKFAAASRAKVLKTPGGGYLTLGDFDDFFIKQGDRAKTFWDKSVRPNWKLWLGSTALATILATPDEYLDHAGNLLAGAIAKIGRVGGKAIEGALATTGEVVGDTLWTILRAFVSHPLGAAIVGVGGLLALGGLERPIRRVCRLVAFLVSLFVSRRRDGDSRAKSS